MVLAVAVFVIALVARLAIIVVTPGSEDYVDIGIYANSGQLIAAGVNPYDFEDEKDVRRELRLDDFAYNEFVCESQEKWDYYANGNLPLTLIFFGVVETFFPYNLAAYRVSFAVADALLSAIICLLILRFWRPEVGNPVLFSVFALGAFSPFLLFDGTVIPEDKGVQILFMVLAVYSSLCPRTRLTYSLTIVFLGASIAFKGIGLFLVPICFIALEKRTPRSLREFFDKEVLARFLVYLFLVFMSTVVYLLPFLPEVLDMARGRLATETAGTVAHASIWTIFAQFLSPRVYESVRLGGLLVFALLLLFGFLKRAYGVVILSFGFLILFLNYWLLSGAMNRLNMSIVIALVTLGVFYELKGLLYFYGVGSSLAVASIVVTDFLFPAFEWQVFCAVFNLLFVVLFCVFAGRNFRRQRENLLA